MLCKISRIGKSTGTESKSVIASGWETKDTESLLMGVGFLLRVIKKKF